MLGSLKAFISGIVADAGLQSENKNRRIATAALLIRVASVSGEMSQPRRVQLHVVLKSCFGLDDISAAKLIDDATAADRSAVDLYHFTRQLNGIIDDEDRRRIVKMMWEVVYADEVVNELESNIVWRAADLLSVSSRQRIELRRIAADRAVLARA
jgi:uncharacterized tellurite resistance protein B-like protein